MPRRLRLGLEARRHPVLTHFFDDGRNVIVSCLPEQFGLRPFPRRPEQWLAPTIDAMKQDRQQQSVIDAGEISERSPSDSLNFVAAWKPSHHGPASTSWFGLRAKIGSKVSGALVSVSAETQLPTSCPEATLFRAAALGLMRSGP